MGTRMRTQTWVSGVPGPDLNSVGLIVWQTDV